jgi:glycosyltransferase involved in cell wall biosynthesis
MERACTELVCRGSSEFEFTVLSGTLSDQLRAVVAWSRIPLIQRPFALKFLNFYLVAAFRIAGRHADLIHTMGAIIPNRVDLATIHYCHAGFYRLTGRLAPREAPLLRRANTALGRLLALIAERWSYRPSRTTRLAAVSPGVAAELALHYPNVSVHVTPNGVDTERFTPGWPGRARFRELAGANAGDIVTLFVGGDWSRKGLALAIQALALAQRQVDRRLQLWVVGQGELGRFREFARDYGVADQVQFFGRRSDVERFYQSADIFVIPTIYETFSLAAYEAACCGLPVIGTRVSGIEELVGANEAGILADRTPDAIAVALARLALDGDARLRMGQAASSRAKTFTWQRSADAVLAVYRELLARQSLVSHADRDRRGERRRTEAG